MTNIKKSFCLWFTGLPSSGKTTLGKAVKEKLNGNGLNMIHLDGDVLRKGLNSDLGFSKEDRDENIRRVMYIAQLQVENYIPVIVSFISPYKSVREKAKELIPNMIEVFINCPVEECEKRDVKGLYEKARKGEIKNMTGVDDPYEEPDNPDLEIHTHEQEIEESAQKVLDYLEKKGFISN